MKKVLTLSILLVILLGFTQFAHAADFNFLEQVVDSNPQALNADGTYNTSENAFVGSESQVIVGKLDSEVSTFIVNLVKTAIGLLGSLMLIHLVVGAYHYVTAAGDEEKTKKAKATIIQAIIGFIIAILSYSIINVVVSVVGQKDAGTAGFQYELPQDPPPAV